MDSSIPKPTGCNRTTTPRRREWIHPFRNPPAAIAPHPIPKHPLFCIRYRGYYYDTETGFYYLQSRYYDPVTHRFINADSLASTGQGFIGMNMFAYCGNNPVLRVDCAGRFWETIYEIFVAPLVDTAEFLYDIYDGSEDLLWDIISVAVDIYGYELTAELLRRASVDDGGAYIAYPGSYASDLCKHDVSLLGAIKSDLQAKNQEKTEVYGRFAYVFPLSNGDLGAALHEVRVTYIGVKVGDVWKITVRIADTFDFTQFKNPLAKENRNAFLLWCANDIAYLDEAMGFLQPVKVIINFVCELGVDV